MKNLFTVCWMFIAACLQGQVCDPTGNLVIYSNYDGGIVTINVDQNIPNLVIGICTYEPVDVTLIGPFVGNVVQVIYAGFNSVQNNNNCGQGNFITSIVGVDPGIITISPPQDPPQVGYTPAHGNGSGPWGGGMIGVAGNCDTTQSAGGGNTPDEVVFYFEDQTGATLYAHYTQYACWQNDVLNISDGGNCCIDVTPPTQITGCDPLGNVMIWSNYNGGVLNIDVDQNIPNLKVGICTYEAVEVNFSGAFVGNITEVIYAGFDGGNNNCGNGPPTTVINGVPPGIVTQYSQTLGNIAIANYLGEPLGLGFPPLVNCITGAEGECSTSNNGGGNSAPQIVQFFLMEFGVGSALFGHFVQYDCFGASYALSAGGNCCLTETGTPPNPIYVGPATYDFIPYADTILCGGPITIDLSAYEVLFQPPTYPGYVWSDGTTGPVITITEPGTYSFYVGDYCHSDESNWLVDTVVVLPCCDPGPANSVINTIFCAGVDNGSIAVAPLGLNDPFTFLWNTTPPQFTSGINNLGPGSYTVVITDSAGCDTALTFVLDAPPPFSVVISGDSVLCTGGTTELTAEVTGGSAPVELVWSPQGTGTSITLQAVVSTLVSVTATDGVGCTVQDELLVQVGSGTSASFVSDANAVCAGTDVQFTATASGADSLVWQLGSAGTSTSASPLVNFTDAGEEIITLTAYTGGCASEPFTDTVVVTAPVELQLSATSSPCALTVDLVLFLSNADTCAIWLNGIQQPSACAPVQQLTVDAVGTYTLQVAANNTGGCGDTLTTTVEIAEGFGLYLPNVFTPNNDGINEEFGLPYLVPSSDFSLRVFNRWGLEVYATNDPQAPWNGQQDGKPVPDGVYLFLVNTRDPCEPTTKRELRGHVTVLR
ncbi:MAG: gliding motility-associated C-terminal domain-containing protein [Flavobacteriales bacterium]|nr:gliding motility-associated C-terminal domain-containing protein [Flavobacteriales bacterium]